MNPLQKTSLFLFILLFIQVVSATCDSNQVDINTASLGELDEIIWIGEATAEKIIAARSFSKIDDLTKVSGIGEVKLQDIKDQGLACVESQEEEQETEEEENEEYTVQETKTLKETKTEITNIPIVEDKKDPIELSSHTSLTQKDEEVIYKSKSRKIWEHSSFFFVLFLLIILLLVVLRR